VRTGGLVVGVLLVGLYRLRRPRNGARRLDAAKTSPPSAANSTSIADSAVWTFDIASLLDPAAALRVAKTPASSGAVVRCASPRTDREKDCSVVVVIIRRS